MGIVRNNPVLWSALGPKCVRESAGWARRGIWFIGLLLALYGGLLPFLHPKYFVAEHVGLEVQLFAWWLAAVTCLLAPMATAWEMAREFERGSWDALVVSRLSPAQIITGKLLRGMGQVYMATLIFLPFCLVLVAVIYPRAPEATSMVPLYSVLGAFGAAALGGAGSGALGIMFSFFTNGKLWAMLWSVFLVVAASSAALLMGWVVWGLMIAHFDELDKWRRSRRTGAA